MDFIRAFGQAPDNREASRFLNYPNFSKTGFRNLSDTRVMTGKKNFPGMLWEFMNRPKDCFPAGQIPLVNTDLQKIQVDEGSPPVLVWFGHSSYLIFINGLRILVDPVFSGYASPFSFTTKSFPGSDGYGVDDMPGIDYLLITHDHYDHLDYKTVSRLQSKSKQVITSLGVGSHLRYWGWPEEKIRELGWWEDWQINGNTQITATPARHFSGRNFTRNKTLWSSFVLEAGSHRIYLGGDSGYDSHFREAGKRFGPFDLAILESGQYNPNWSEIHMMPEQTVQAALDLGAATLLAVHWGKFSLALHPWNEPIQRVAAAAQGLGQRITTPRIGEPITLNTHLPQSEWWKL